MEMLAYVKNLSLDINGITRYKPSNHVLPDFSHLKVVNCRYIFLMKKWLGWMYTIGKEFLLVIKVKISIVFTIQEKKKSISSGTFS